VIFSGTSTTFGYGSVGFGVLSSIHFHPFLGFPSTSRLRYIWARYGRQFFPETSAQHFPVSSPSLFAICLNDTPLSRILHTGPSLRYCRMSRSSYSGFQKSRMNSRLSQSPSSFARSSETSTCVYGSQWTRCTLPPPSLPFAPLAAWPLEADPSHRDMTDVVNCHNRKRTDSYDPRRAAFS